VVVVRPEVSRSKWVAMVVKVLHLSGFGNYDSSEDGEASALVNMKCMDGVPRLFSF